MTIMKNNKEVGFIKKALLPEEYQRVEYIQSTGTQYIDTGVRLSNTTGVDITAEIKSSADKMIFAHMGYLRVGSNNYGLYYAWSGTSFTPTTYRPQIQNIKFNTQVNYYNSRKILYNGVYNANYGTISTVTGQSTSTATIFGRKTTSGTVDYLINAKLYSLKITDENSLVREFIPCYRKSDGEIGVYDIVNGVFYTNQGTGTFTKGGDISGDNVVKVYYGEDVVFYGLPSAYQKVEYIQSDGNQYIDTVYIPNNTAKIRYIFSPLAATTGTLMFGCWGNTDTAGRLCIYVNGTKLQYGFGKGAGVSGVNYKDFADDVILNSKYNLLMDNTSCYSNGLLAVDGLSGTNAGNTRVFWIGKCNDLNNRATNPTKIYSCTIWNDGSLLKKFIPCYRKSDSVVGMYDVVNGVFYTNQGTGNFVVGSDV